MQSSAFFCVLLQKNETFSRSFTFFAKERCVLCKRMLRSFPFFRKGLKRTEHSFGSTKSPKTRKKDGKERNVPNGKERGVQPC